MVNPILPVSITDNRTIELRRALRAREKALKKSEKPQHRIEYERIIKLADDLIAVAGMDGYFKYLNPAWEKVLGYTREELLARPYLDIVHPDDRARVRAELKNLASGRHSLNFEDRYLHKDGSVRYFTWQSTPIPEDSPHLFHRPRRHRTQAGGGGYHPGAQPGRPLFQRGRHDAGDPGCRGQDYPHQRYGLRVARLRPQRTHRQRLVR